MVELQPGHIIDKLATLDGQIDLFLIEGAKHNWFQAKAGDQYSAAVPVQALRLLGWRRGHLVASRRGAGGQDAGLLSPGGDFETLRPSAGRGEVYLQYQPDTDRLLFTLASEHSADPVLLFVTHPGLTGESPWPS